MNTLKADFTQEFTLSFYRLAQNLVFQFVTHIYIYIYKDCNFACCKLVSYTEDGIQAEDI